MAACATVGPVVACVVPVVDEDAEPVAAAELWVPLPVDSALMPEAIPSSPTSTLDLPWDRLPIRTIRFAVHAISCKTTRPRLGPIELSLIEQSVEGNTHS